MAEPARIAVLGAGREGQAAQRFAAHRWPAATVDIFDEGPAAPDPPGGAEDWQAYDLVITSPGWPPHHPVRLAAAAGGAAVTSGTALWFAEGPRATTVVVTGTKGKSTTAAALGHVLAHAGKNVSVAGNIGKPLLDLGPQDAGAIVVAELSSYQLHDLDFRCSIGVLLNLFPEHLDWHGSADHYYAAKLRLVGRCGRLFASASPTLTARVERAAATWVNEPQGLHVRDDVLYAGERCIGQLRTPLPGRHNLENLCVVVAVAEALGVAPQTALAALEDFRGLPHRLMRLGACAQGIVWVDDSISTTPHSTLAAVRACPERPLSLLVGGFDRGLDWSAALAELVELDVTNIIGVGALGRRIIDQLPAASLSGASLACPDLSAAVSAVRELMPAGGVCLLSPGAPSFDAYRDYVARGEAFAAAAGVISS